MTQMNEIGFYTLAGAPETPRELIDEVRQAEELGIGNVFISERLNIKEAATVSGAVGVAAANMGIATAATNHHTRHPVVTGAYAMTMHKLTGGRFCLGIGRGVDLMSMAFGLQPITTAQMEDFVGLMRRLWAGETIFNHDGPAGSFPVLTLRGAGSEHIPMALTAFGPNSLALGGRCFDAVVLHTFFTDETTARVAAAVRQSAVESGRDPDAVKVWSCFATIGDHLPEDIRLKKTVGRMATYLQGYPDLMVRTNNWDPAVIERFQADPVVAGIGGAIDQAATTEQLEHIAGLIPEEWLAPAATGTPAQCVERIRGQFDLGCDGVILHGASPDQLRPIVEEYARTRPTGRFDHLPANPGG